jgi:hypothetical protein
MILPRSPFALARHVTVLPSFFLIFSSTETQFFEMCMGVVSDPVIFVSLFLFWQRKEGKAEVEYTRPQCPPRTRTLLKHFSPVCP